MDHTVLSGGIVASGPTETPLLEGVNEWDRVATSRWGAYVSAIERRAILRAQHLRPMPMSGLDLGCGAGRWSRLLADNGWTMTCTDVNADALRICQRRSPEATCILRSPDDRVLPCASNSIGLLLCIEVPPVMQSDWFMPESARVLAHGGLLVAVCWNLLSGRGLFCHARAAFGWDADFYKSSYVRWKRQARAHGFRVIHEEGFCWFPHRRNSDSALVRVSTTAEGRLGLRKLTTLSPWVVAVLQKR